MKIFNLLGLLLALTMCQAAKKECSKEKDGHSKWTNVGKEIGFDEELQKHKLTSFRTFLIKTKLFDDLNDPSKSHTVFAPTNAAFQKLPSTILSDIPKLTEVLKYHVHPGSFKTSSIQKDMKLKTELGGQKKIRFEFYSGVTYGSCKPFGDVIDETYNNGILDTFNGVMIPPEGSILDILSQDESFATFQSYANKGHLKQLIQDLHSATFLAPNEAAFKKLPADVKDKLNNDRTFLHKFIEYHFLDTIYCSAGFKNGQTLETIEGSIVTVKVSEGKVIFNNGSSLIQNDTIAYNGVVHTIDTVLLPP